MRQTAVQSQSRQDGSVSMEHQFHHLKEIRIEACKVDSEMRQLVRHQNRVAQVVKTRSRQQQRIKVHSLDPRPSCAADGMDQNRRELVAPCPCSFQTHDRPAVFANKVVDRIHVGVGKLILQVNPCAHVQRGGGRTFFFFLFFCKRH